MKTGVETGVKTGVPAGYVQGTAAARTRDVERDSMLKTALSAAPSNTTSVWLRGYEVRMEAASTAVEAKMCALVGGSNPEGAPLWRWSADDLSPILGSLTI
jgi:hypothetical protein